MTHFSRLGATLALCLAAPVACSSDDDVDPMNTTAPASPGGESMAAGGGSMAAGGGSMAAAGGGSIPAGAELSFFVTSQTHPNGDLGGLAGADTICQNLAKAAVASGKTWRAYLSAEDDGSGNPIHARDRIGTGPWVNAAGATVAENLEALHSLRGSDTLVLAELMLDEQGERVNGQWEGSPDPNQHDVLTGSTPEGQAMPGMTCESWTSASSDLAAQVGHSDGLGPNRNPEGNFGSWNSSHANQSCADTNPRGGAGKFYCFAQ